MRYILNKRLLITGVVWLSLAGVVFMLVCNLYVLQSAEPHIVSDIAELETAQAIMVLGAGVFNDGELTPILKDRVDTALTVYQAGKASRILISGDNSTTTYNEVIPVYEYLLQQGVPANVLFIDYAGFNTYDSLYRAHGVFLVESLIVVTQNYYLPRAIYIGDQLSLNVQGISSEITDLQFSDHLREVLARVKSVIEVTANRRPKFLGETIPITGSGMSTVGE